MSKEIYHQKSCIPSLPTLRFLVAGDNGDHSANQALVRDGSYSAPPVDAHTVRRHPIVSE